MKQEPEGFAEFWSGQRLPSLEYLHEALRYDPETGLLYWRERPAHHFKAGRCKTEQSAADKWNRANAGNAASSNNGSGYRRLSMAKKPYYAHRIIWKMHTGEEPEVIDHLNGNRSDNRIFNLRGCTQADNSRNQSRPHGAGVYKMKHFGWYGQVPIDGRIKSKLFKTREEAIAWRAEVALSQGFTPRHVGAANA